MPTPRPITVPTSFGAGLAAAWVVGLAIPALAVLWPAGVALVQCVGAAARGPVGGGSGELVVRAFDGVLLAKSVGWAGLIAMIAVLLAWPGAWVLRGRSGWLGPASVVAMLVPSYLASSGWGLLRAPGTWVGNAIEELAARGWTSLPIHVGVGLAVMGLALWAWPMAMMVTAVGVGAVDEGVLEALDADAGWVGRVRERAKLSWPGAVSAWGVVFLVMMGSAIPLHLAQLDTYALRVWLTLDLTSAQDKWKVWAAAWPLLVIAGVGAWWVVGWARRVAAVQWRETDAARDASRAAAVFSWAVFGLGVLAPIGLFAWSIHSARSLTLFWTLSGRALENSLEIAALTSAAGVAAAVGLWAGWASGGWRAWISSAALSALVFAGLMPGVLVGSAVNRAFAGVPAVSSSLLVVVLAHTARFGFLPCLVAAWAAASEPREMADLRATEGRLDLPGFLRACVSPRGRTLVATGAAVAALSLHEIEAAIQVHPPGMELLARKILDHLHFSRMEDMAAAVVWVVGGAVVLGLVAAGAARTGRRAGEEAPSDGR